MGIFYKGHPKGKNNLAEHPMGKTILQNTQWEKQPCRTPNGKNNLAEHPWANSRDEKTLLACSRLLLQVVGAILSWGNAQAFIEISIKTLTRVETHHFADVFHAHLRITLVYEERHGIVDTIVVY